MQINDTTLRTPRFGLHSDLPPSHLSPFPLLCWLLVVLVAQLVSRHSRVADRLPVVVRFPAGPRARLKTVDPPKCNGLVKKTFVVSALRPAGVTLPLLGLVKFRPRVSLYTRPPFSSHFGCPFLRPCCLSHTILVLVCGLFARVVRFCFAAADLGFSPLFLVWLPLSLSPCFCFSGSPPLPALPLSPSRSTVVLYWRGQDPTQQKAFGAMKHGEDS